MEKFMEMQVFAAVVDAGSFVKASEALDLSKASVSRYMNDLESRLGVRLLQRTTRRLSLTEEGNLFYPRCKELLSGIDEAEAEITSHSRVVSGVVRVNAPVSFGIRHLAPLWGRYRARYPQVTLDITLSDSVVDIVDEGYDLAIRSGALSNSSLVSRRLAGTRWVLCASPQFITQYGAPRSLQELAQYPLAAYSFPSNKDEWHFEGAQGKVSIQITPCFRTNSVDTCRAVALAHEGITRAPLFLVAQDLADGSLVELMPEYKSTERSIFAVYPTRKYMLPKVRTLIEFLTDSFDSSRCPW
jgi:DNA-binding transcriptional LysR family regulator